MFSDRWIALSRTFAALAVFVTFQCVAQPTLTPTVITYLAVIGCGTVIASFLISPDTARIRWKKSSATHRRLANVVRVAVVAHIILGVIGRRSGLLLIGSGAAEWAGVGVCASCMAMLCWTVVLNPFLTPGVSVDAARRQFTVVGGPYRYVRHPHYANCIALWFGSILASGSWLSGLPFLPVFVLLIRRILNEDAFLCIHLPGYRLYQLQVQYRLLPYLW